jgi:hypothetical protein
MRTGYGIALLCTGSLNKSNDEVIQMKMFPATCLAAAVFVAALVAPRHALAADVFPIQPPQQVKEGCGGIYYPPTRGNGGVYGCVYSDGHGQSCGGSGKYAKTCTAYAAPPKRPPTQEEIETIAKARHEPINSK